MQLGGMALEIELSLHIRGRNAAGCGDRFVSLAAIRTGQVARISKQGSARLVETSAVGWRLSAWGRAGGRLRYESQCLWRARVRASLFGAVGFRSTHTVPSGAAAAPFLGPRSCHLHRIFAVPPN